MEGGESQFGPWLRRKLLERHLSLAQLCRTVGCDYTYLWRIINSETAKGRKYTRPSYAMTRKVGEALDATREALAAAGYEAETTLEEARLADRLARLEQDMAELRSSLAPGEMRPLEEVAFVRLPLLGHIRAGDLHEALENPEDLVVVPQDLAGGAGFLLRVRGDSMHPTLVDGDQVAVREQITAEPGQIVVAFVDGETTLKRYETVDGIPTLVADNPQWPPVRFCPGVRIGGVVTGSFRPPDVLRRRPA